MTTLLRAHAKQTGALRKGRRRACQCCSNYGSTKSGPRNRQVARQQQRRIEQRQWQAEVATP